MANRGQAIEILDEQNNLLYPRTNANNVYFGDTGKMVGTALGDAITDIGNLQTKTNNIDTEVTEARNSQTTNYPNLKTRLDDMDSRIGQGGGGGNLQEVVDARNDAISQPPVNHPTLGDRLDSMQQQLLNANSTNKEVEDAREDAKTPSETHDNLKKRLDSDYNYLKSEIEKTNTQLSEINNKKITYLTPEMFGAVGDGVTDDVEPLMRLINYVKSNAPQIDVGGGEMLRDYGVFTFVFKGKYAISSQIIIDGGYNLSINDLYLTSTKNFNGESLVKVVSTFRNSWLKNCIFDGNKWTTSCFLLEGNSLNNQFTSCTFRRFKDYGFKAINKGHELIFDGCKFNQFEWGDRDKGVIPDFLVDGVGLGLYDDRHDNHISNCIINYCLGHALDIFSDSNLINNTHFYSGESVEYGVYVKGSHNFFNSCFFDGSLVGLNGQNSIKNSFFMTSGDHTFIEFMDSESNKWKYGVSEVMGNRFQGNTSQISLPFKCKNFDFDNTFSNIYDNTFHNCLDVWRWYSKASESYNPSPFTKFSENLSDTGYQIIGNIKYVWGYATDSTITIDCSRILNVQATGWSSPPNSPYAPYVTAITNNSFKLNCHGTACYFVVCVV